MIPNSGIMIWFFRSLTVDKWAMNTHRKYPRARECYWSRSIQASWFDRSNYLIVMLLTYRIIASGRIGGIKTKTTGTPPLILTQATLADFLFRPAHHGILFTGYCIHMQFYWVCEFVSFRKRKASRREKQNVCVWQTWHGFYFRVLSWSTLTISVFGFLQKDMFKERLSLIDGKSFKNK